MLINSTKYTFYVFTRRKSFKSSLNHPNFLLPMKSSPIKDAKNVYNFILDKSNVSKSKSKFIIHDGPPFANGQPHVGHALNKILKDIIVRYKKSRGTEVSYIPGWDCHGLPIELKSETLKFSSISVLRKNASNIASKFIDIQKEAFKSWGILGDWDNYYATYNNSYQSKELQAFNILYNKNLVFRNLLPTFWSCSSKTALAEAELEYNDQHKSETVFVKFHLLGNPPSLPDAHNVSLLIWTTTPWTLVANEAVGVRNGSKYLLCTVDGTNEKIITGAFSLERLRQVTRKKIEIISEISGKQLVGCRYRHPIYADKNCVVLDAPFVTETKGTGLVHIAPAHGKDDFDLMKNTGKYDTIFVDDDGVFTDKCGESLCGKSVFGSGIDKIISILDKDVFHQEKYIHSYPYDWRTKKPIIIKLSTQWFIDVAKLSNDSLIAYEKVQVTPVSMKEAMLQFLKSRPNWCISRQRKWGVPIPVLYSANDEPIVDEQFIDHIATRVAKHGADFWWEETVDEIVPRQLLDKWEQEPSKLTKSTDIFDIWFDSGLSWWCTLPDTSVADLYLEGIDQFRGWFSSSLLTGVALTGRSPYKSIVTHGFTVDGEGRKMSKSIGNVMDPADVIDKYGVDVLRYWACASGCSMKNIISPLVLKRIESQYSLLRNMFRFMIGNMSKASLPPSEEITDISSFQSLLPQDRYILHVIAQDYIVRIMERYDKYQFEGITPLIEELIPKVSNFYFTIIKDRLYCDSVTSESYLSCVKTLALLMHSIVPVCAPILPCLCQEINDALMSSNIISDGRLFPWPDFVSTWRDNNIFDVLGGVVLPIRHSLSDIDLLSHGFVISNKFNQFAELTLEVVAKDPGDRKGLQNFNNGSWEWQSHSPLCEVLRCAAVKVAKDGVEGQGWIEVVGGRWAWRLEQRSEESRCPRCWRYTREGGECCERCTGVLDGLGRTAAEEKSRDNVRM